MRMKSVWHFSYLSSVAGLHHRIQMILLLSLVDMITFLC
jgi:hypothetical protein